MFVCVCVCGRLHLVELCECVCVCMRVCVCVLCIWCGVCLVVCGVCGTHKVNKLVHTLTDTCAGCVSDITLVTGKLFIKKFPVSDQGHISYATNSAYGNQDKCCLDKSLSCYL